jgi:hypothetical protein
VKNWEDGETSQDLDPFELGQNLRNALGSLSTLGGLSSESKQK